MRANEEMILLALGLFKSFGRELPPDKQELATIVGVKGDTLDRYIKHLLDTNILEKNTENDPDSFVLTKKGNDLASRLFEELLETDLIPERHAVSKVCKFRILRPRIKDMGSFIKIASLVRKKRTMDVIEMQYTMSALRSGSEERLRIQEILNQTKYPMGSVDKIYSDNSLLGLSTKRSRPSIPITDVSTALIVADIKRRCGKVEEAFSIFNGLRSDKPLDPGHWIVCVVGCIFCLKVLKSPASALDEIDKLLKKVKEPSHKVLLLYAKADILSDLEEFEEATRIYRTCIGMMNALELSRIQVELLNSLGVHYFRQKKIHLAEVTWKRSLNLSNKYGFQWVKALIEINLSDCESLRGNHRTAWNKIGRAERILEEYGDLEGLADVNYNKALLSVRQGRIDDANRYFARAEDFPLRYALKKEEWKQVYNECLVENGFDPLT